MQSRPDQNISVVIPAHNSERFVGECLESVLAQSLPPLEVIVVDDGSSDGTRDIVGSFGDSVRLIEQDNMGAGAARNLGVQHARGAWIAFLDSDDSWRHDKLAIQYSACRDAAWSHTDYTFIGDGHDSEVRGSDLAEKFGGEILARLVVNNTVGTSTVLVQREAFLEAGGFDQSLWALQDWDLWLKIASRHPIVYVDEPLTNYRIHGSSTSRSPRKTKPYHLELIDRIYGPGGVGERFPELRRKSLAESFMILSIIAEEMGDDWFSLDCAARSAWYHPMDPGRWKAVARTTVNLVRGIAR